MKNIIILSAVIILFAIITVHPTRAESTHDPSEPDLNYEIRFGVLAHDVDDLWSGSKKESGVDYNFEIILRSHCLSFLKGSICPNSGVSINSQGDTSRLYLGLLWEHKIKSGIFIDLGLGATLHNGELETSDPEKKELGSRVLFRIPIEIGYTLNKHHRLFITFEHISNAYLANPNEGMDSLGLRYGYSF